MRLLCDCAEEDWVDTDSWCVCCVIALRRNWVGHRQLMCLLCDCVEEDWVDTDSWCICCVIVLRRIELDTDSWCVCCVIALRRIELDTDSWCVCCVIALRGGWVDTDSWCVCCVIALRRIELTQTVDVFAVWLRWGWLSWTQTVDVFAVWLRWGGLSWQRQLMCLLCDCVEGDWVDTYIWCVCCVIALRGIELTQTVDVFAVWLRWGGLSWHRQLMCLLCYCVEGIELTQTVDVFTVLLRWGGLSWQRQLMCLLCDCIKGDWVDTYIWCVCCVIALRGIELTQTVDGFAVLLRWGGLSWHRQLMCLLCYCIEGDWVDTDSWCVCCVTALRGIELTQTVDVFAVLLRWGGWVDKGSWCVCCVTALRGIELTQTVDVFVAAAGPE